MPRLSLTCALTRNIRGFLSPARGEDQADGNAEDARPETASQDERDPS
jgi:hypothetical protein